MFKNFNPFLKIIKQINKIIEKIKKFIKILSNFNKLLVPANIAEENIVQIIRFITNESFECLSFSKATSPLVKIRWKSPQKIKKERKMHGKE